VRLLPKVLGELLFLGGCSQTILAGFFFHELAPKRMVNLLRNVNSM
jgi:hypothetical protein